MQALRDETGVPFTPNCVFRSLTKNRSLKSEDTSRHLKGDAFDIPYAPFKAAGYTMDDLKVLTRKLGWKGLVANKLLLLSIIGGLIMQIVIVYVPFFQNIFHTTALSASDMIVVLVCSGTGMAVLPEIFIHE